MPKNPRCVTLRMIAHPADRDGVLTRLHTLCEEQGMVCDVSRDIPYWKIPNRMETVIEIEDCPTWNYGKWSQIYHDLFLQELTIEWESEGTIRFYTYPPADSEDMWIDFRIPSVCFWPKPSKDIRH
ncbi:MAG: hypothetical protein IJX72_02150 [Clostridia bacterium]|nr:hypothetical protein [Clostridia bacterium]